MSNVKTNDRVESKSELQIRVIRKKCKSFVPEEPFVNSTNYSHRPIYTKIELNLLKFIGFINLPNARTDEMNIMCFYLKSLLSYAGQTLFQHPANSQMDGGNVLELRSPAKYSISFTLFELKSEKLNVLDNFVDENIPMAGRRS